MDTLLAIGAGPKSLAVAVKAAVLRELRLPAPRVTIAEAHTPGANWLPVGGWTDGQQRLGTSPEKDIGFPYRSNLSPEHNQRVNRAMTQYSWTSYLIARGGYAEWIDRGRPHPRHREWAAYLGWAAAECGAEIISGAAASVSADGKHWRTAVPGHGEITSDAIMFTGPGSSNHRVLAHPRVLSVAQFWELASRRELPAASRAAVIGGGETAGSALAELARHDVMSISVISPRPTLYTRGESYFENALFSDPSGWHALSAAERSEVIRHTDRGVFSVRVQESLLEDNRIHHLRGRVTTASARDGLIALTLANGGQAARVHTFDLVVDATGGQPLWFLDIFDSAAADLIELAIGWPVTKDRLADSIGHDLAVSGLTPKLYLPGIAGFAQGPGFPNLSCLGMLSDRILRPALVREALPAGS